MPDAPIDLDAFLDARRRLVRTVQFHRADDLLARQDDLERRYAVAEKNLAAEDATGEPAEQSMAEANTRGALDLVEAELQALADEWDERGTQVTVEERTRAELLALTKPIRRQLEKDLVKERKAGRDGASLRDDHAEAILLTQLAECLVEPAFTVEQLRTLRRSSITGEASVDQMWRAVQEVCATPATPFSRQPSRTPGGDSSAPS